MANYFRNENLKILIRKDVCSYKIFLENESIRINKIRKIN